MGTREEQQLEGARRQSLFRHVNERIEAITLAAPGSVGEILCECANLQCAEPIEMALDEYEKVRLVPTHFFVKPGHVVPDIERVVEENGRYVVVEKFGEAGKGAVSLDPRRESADDPAVA